MIVTTATGRSMVHVPPLETKYVEALCPSFDHAASLGFTLTDQTPAQHLHDG